MYDPFPNQKDQFIQTFEGLISRKHELDEVDEKMRDEIQNHINEYASNTHVSQDA